MSERLDLIAQLLNCKSEYDDYLKTWGLESHNDRILSEINAVVSCSDDDWEDVKLEVEKTIAMMKSVYR